MDDSLGERLARVETKLDLLLSAQDRWRSEADELARRVGALERWKAALPAALLTAIASAAVALIGS